MKNSFDNILNFEISKFSNEANKHKKQWRRGQTLIIMLITMSSILSTISASSSGYSIWFSLSSAICSSSAIAISSWLEMRKSFEVWKTETNILHGLLDLKRHVQFEKLANNWSKKSESEAMNNIEKIIRTGKLEWKQIQK